MKKLIAVCTTALLAASAVILGVALPAAAHTPSISATCDALSVNLQYYQQGSPGSEETSSTTYQRYSWIGGHLEAAPTEVPPSSNWQVDNKKKPGDDPIGQAFQQGNGENASWFYWLATTTVTPGTPAQVNTVSVLIDDVVVLAPTVFGTSFSQTFAFTPNDTTHTYEVIVRAWDDPVGTNGWSFNERGTSGECGPQVKYATPTQPTATAGIEQCVNGQSVDAKGTIVLPEFEGGHWVEASGTLTGITPGEYAFTAIADDGYELVLHDVDGLMTDLWFVTVPQSVDVNCDVPPVVTNTQCEVFTDAGTSTNENANGWVDYDTRSAGHAVYVDGGLHVYTDDATSNAKVSWAHALNIPLSEVGQLSVDYTNNEPGWFAYGPGINLFVDITGDGAADGTLVYESVYGQDLWVTNGSAQALKDASLHTGGNGSANHGTIDHYLTTFPDATVVGFAFALGSGVHADGVIHSINVGCATYSFDYIEPIGPKPDDKVVTSEWVDGQYECGDTTVEQSRTVSTTSYVLEGREWVEGETTIVTETQTRDLTADELEALNCPVPPTETPAPPHLAYTGTDGEVAGMIGIGAGLLLLLGAGLTAGQMIRERRKASAK